ncbi:MAG: glycosyltransferase family 39 protein [Solirubrobacterales bacterium]|nr:glycosyltransferase family 39 protein [Solirubrobacterales bacterium]
MSISISAPDVRTPPRQRALARARTLRRPRPELAALVVLAATLNLVGLGQNAWANTYYSAAVRSMASSWHNFLYASFDPAGVMTVDKPPLALWVQAASARVFGFNTWSLLVPQALMGIVSVALVYDLVARRFGRAAGFAGGLALAVTPITVAMARHNNPDALLVLCSTAALWFLVRGLEDGRTRWLVLCGVMVGLGFETKMAAALLVVPAIAAAYLYVAPTGRVRALWQLTLGGAAMTVVALAWPVLMWLTPAGSRPWISGTSDNSIWSLIFGYNGLGRVDGQAGGPGAAGGGPGGGAGGGNLLFGGQTGPLRLLNQALGGQAGWLLGFALVGLVVIAASTRLKRSDARTGWLIAVGGAFLVTTVVFSEASGIFHPYYVSALAPFAAALVGATAAVIAKGGLVARIGGPLAVAGGVATELVILHDNPTSLPWLAPVLGVVVVAAAVGLGVLGAGRIRVAVVAAALGVLLIAPATWATETLGYATQSTFPAGGPASSGMGFGGGPGGGGRGGFGGGGTRPSFAPPGAQAGGAPAAPPAGGAGGAGGPGAGGQRGGGGRSGGNSNVTQAVAYAEAHGGGTIVVSSQQGASDTIITADPTQPADVAGIGGYSGKESQVSIQWLANAVRDGRIRWVLTDGSGGGGRADARTGSTTVMTAAAQVGTPVNLTAGGTGSTTTDTAAAGVLYDLQGQADALLALAG